MRFCWRHLFALACLAFVVYMLFISDYSVTNIMSLEAQQAELSHEISVYKDSIANFEQRIEEISVDNAELERHARERMYMHRENEDLYILDD